MRNKQETMCLFFPQPMDDVDKNNLITSQVKRVQLFLNVAYNNREQLRWLAVRGYRVIFRIEEPSRNNAAEVASSYYTPAGRADIVRKIGEIKQDIPSLIIEGAICGNEPDIEYDLTRGSDNWGDKPEPNFAQGRAWEHQSALGQVREQLTAMGLKVVSPGLSHRRRRPRQKPQPGRAMWARVCTLEYNKCHAGGCHDYAEGYTSPEDENRFLWAVGIDVERVHVRVWLNEAGIDSSPNEIARMHSILAMYDLLATNTEENWSEVVDSFCTFVNNGLPGQQWSHMIMRDPRCYAELGRWMVA